MGSFAYTLSGTVSDDNGQAVSGAQVSLIKENKSTTTDEQGKFTIHEEEIIEVVSGASALLG